MELFMISALKADGTFMISALKAVGTFMNYLLESRRNLIDISACKQSELYSFSKGNKGFAFGNGIMSYADGTGEGPSQAEGPSPEGPLAIWHKPQLAPEVGLDRHLTA